MKNKISYTISTPHNLIFTVSVSFSSPRQQFAESHGSGAKIKESYFTWLKAKFFFTGVNRNSPKLQGVKTY